MPLRLRRRLPVTRKERPKGCRKKYHVYKGVLVIPYILQEVAALRCFLSVCEMDSATSKHGWCRFLSKRVLRTKDEQLECGGEFIKIYFSMSPSTNVRLS